MQPLDLDVAVIGGGPGGLAATKAILTARQEAGALLECRRRRLACVTFAAAPSRAAAISPPPAWCKANSHNFSI